MALYSARVCLSECIQKKMNCFFIHGGKKKIGSWHCLCAPFDTNSKRIVSGHNGIFRSQTVAMMDSFLSFPQKETNPEMINKV